MKPNNAPAGRRSIWDGLPPKIRLRWISEDRARMAAIGAYNKANPNAPRRWLPIA